MTESRIITAIKIAILVAVILAAAGQWRAHQPAPADSGVRPAVKAGSWYEQQPADLAAHLTTLLERAQSPVDEQHILRLTSSNEKFTPPLLAMVCPHAAYGYSGNLAARAYDLAKQQSVKRIFILGPLHYSAFHGVVLPTYEKFATPLGDLPVDTATMDQLGSHPLFVRDNHEQRTEHSIELQLPLIRQVFGEIKIVPIYVGRLADQHEIDSVADTLKRFVSKGDLLVVSSDFTHYGKMYHYIPFTADVEENIGKLDSEAYSLVSKRDVAGFLKYRAETHNTICGFYPCCVALSMLPDRCHSTLLDYSTSRDAFRAQLSDPNNPERERCVSYMAIAFSGAPWPSDARTK